MASTNVPANAPVISESVDGVEGNINVSEKNKGFFSTLTEDWWAVIIGGILIAAILLFAIASPGFKFTTPVYQWADTNDLTTKVLAINNLLLIAGIGLVFLIISSVAISLSGGTASKFTKGFALIFVLGVVSLIIAGNK